mmetsp:Transcript_34497/g.86009  ORF Transcript_34497/g.86009 Transcript_34497/m.86009 type:complete len:295 (+) Transcript_34497:264-1148(+)
MKVSTSSPSAREIGMRMRSTHGHRIRGPGGARRLPVDLLVATSWAEAHNLLYQGDMHDREMGVPPGLISTDQLSFCAEIWEKLDSDGSGTLSLDELDRALKLMGYDGTDDDTAELVRLIDEDGSGVIEWEEFRTLLVTKVVEESNQVEVDFTFAMLDLNGDGNIDPREVKTLLMRAGEKLSEAEADDLVHILSADTGSVTMASFQAGMDRIFKARPSTLLAQVRASNGTREARKGILPPRSLPFGGARRNSIGNLTFSGIKNKAESCRNSAQPAPSKDRLDRLSQGPGAVTPRI